MYSGYDIDDVELDYGGESSVGDNMEAISAAYEDIDDGHVSVDSNIDLGDFDSPSHSRSFHSAKTTGETLVGGVIPDNYIHESPGFDALAAAMPFDVWEFDPSNLPDLLLPPPVENEGKMLDLKEQAVGRRVPSGFSQGLPDGVVASWQGRWLVDDSYRAEKG
ncbi:hypothetical protein FOL46_009077, partial [Perkinsus olseni]